MIGALGGAGAVGAVGGLVGNIAALAGAGGKGGEREWKQIAQAWKDLKLADYDFSKLPAPTLRVFAEYMPELYQEVVPDEVKIMADSPEMRGAQVRQLGGYEELARTGSSLQDRVAAQEAKEALAGQQKRGELNILRNLASRGALGSGDEIQARLVGNQGQTNLAAEMGRSLAADAAGRRIGAMGAAAGLAGDIRGQDLGVQRSNADIINAFNMNVSNIRNRARESNAMARERAQFGNVGMRQGVGEQHVMNLYGNAVRNQDNFNRLTGQGFQDRVTKTTGYGNALADVAGAKDLRRKERLELLQSLGRGAGGAAIGGGNAGGGGSALGLF